MSDEETKGLKFLGLGSMVDVNDMDALPDTKYVVIARGVGKNSSGQRILRYRLAPHPIGITPDNQDKLLTVEEAAITQVFSEGYRDEEDDAFLDGILEKLSGSSVEKRASNRSATTEEVQAPVATKVSEDEKLAEEQEKLKQDPFYKFRHKEAE
jgi:hypothetical protein